MRPVGQSAVDGTGAAPRLYIFDMGGVVSRNTSVAAAVASRLGLSVDEFFAAAGAVPGGDGSSPYDHGDIRAIQAGEMDADAFWGRLLARSAGLFPGRPIPVPVTPGGGWEDLWATEFRPKLDPEIVALIANLKASSSRVVCGTNTLAAHYAVHQALGDYACFDRVYASHLMGKVKPDAAFWLEILTREGVGAGEAFFVDDSAANVLSAAALGLNVHRYRGPAELRAALAGGCRSPCPVL